MIGLANDVRLDHFDIPKPVYVLRKTSTNLEFEVEDALEPIVPLLNGRHTLPEIINALPEPSVGTDPLRGFMRDMLAENVPDLLRAMIQQGFLKQTVEK